MRRNGSPFQSQLEPYDQCFNSFAVHSSDAGTAHAKGIRYGTVVVELETHRSVDHFVTRFDISGKER